MVRPPPEAEGTAELRQGRGAVWIIQRGPRGGWLSAARTQVDARRSGLGTPCLGSSARSGVRMHRLAADVEGASWLARGRRAFRELVGCTAGGRVAYGVVARGDHGRVPRLDGAAWSSAGEPRMAKPGCPRAPSDDRTREAGVRYVVGCARSSEPCGAARTPQLRWTPAQAGCVVAASSQSPTRLVRAR